MRVTRKTVGLIGTGAAVVALGVGIPTMAFAQDSSPSPSATSSAADSDGTAQSDRAQERQQRQDKMAELLANELGLSKDQVATALDKVESQLQSDAKTERQAALKERLDAAVAAGTLTQEQADAIVAASAAGVLESGAGGHGPGRHGS